MLNWMQYTDRSLRGWLEGGKKRKKKLSDFGFGASRLRRKKKKTEKKWFTLRYGELVTQRIVSFVMWKEEEIATVSYTQSLFHTQKFCFSSQLLMNLLLLAPTHVHSVHTCVDFFSCAPHKVKQGVFAGAIMLQAFHFHTENNLFLVFSSRLRL